MNDVYITGELIKNSISNKLLELFPDVTVYKEAVTNPVYPHFFIYQVEMSCEKERKNRFILDCTYNVRYRVASDPTTDLKLQQKLDAVSIILLENFDCLKTNDVLSYCVDNNVEKDEGVLFFNTTIRIMVKKKLKEEIKQNKLDFEVRLKK